MHKLQSISQTHAELCLLTSQSRLGLGILPQNLEEYYPGKLASNHRLDDNKYDKVTDNMCAVHGVPDSHRSNFSGWYENSTRDHRAR